MAAAIAKIDTSHRDLIHDAQTDFYGRKLATCSSDRVIRIFDVQPTGQSQQLAELTGHEGPVWQISWSHPKYQSLLASCSYDHKVFIWKETTPNKWQKIFEYAQHEASVNSISWAPYELGCALACGSTDKNITVLYYRHEDNTWSTQRIINAHENGCNAVSWCSTVQADSSPASSGLTGNVTARLVSGGNDGLVKIWKCSSWPTAEWELAEALSGHSDWVRDVAWAPSPNAQRQMIASCGTDKRVLIWTSLENGKFQSSLLCACDDIVWHVNWSHCGSMLACAHGDNEITLWKESLSGQWKCISNSGSQSGAETSDTTQQ